MANQMNTKSIDIWIERIAKLAVPLTIGIIGWHYSELQREREDVSTVIELVTSGDDLTRTLGTTYAGDLNKRNRLPDSIRVTLFNYGVNLQSQSNDSNKEAGKKLVAVLLDASTDPESAKELVETAYQNETSPSQTGEQETTIPARIYFHIQKSGTDQRSIARGVELTAEKLRIGTRSIVVPGIQAVSTVTGNHELRCFRTEECEAVKMILPKLEASIKGLTLKDLSSRYQDSTKIRPFHFELWFGPGPITNNEIE